MKGEKRCIDLIVAWMRSSVSRSTAAVASSRTKILVFLRMARARQTSCLWPTERFEPPSTTTWSRLPVSLCTREIKYGYYIGTFCVVFLIC